MFASHRCARCACRTPRASRRSRGGATGTVAVASSARGRRVHGTAGRGGRQVRPSDRLWRYPQDCARKHRRRDNGFASQGGRRDAHAPGPLPRGRLGDPGAARRRTDPAVPDPRGCARLMGFDRPGEPPFRIPVSGTQACRQFGNAAGRLRARPQSRKEIRRRRHCARRPRSSMPSGRSGDRRRCPRTRRPASARSRRRRTYAWLRAADARRAGPNAPPPWRIAPPRPPGDLPRPSLPPEECCANTPRICACAASAHHRTGRPAPSRLAVRPDKCPEGTVHWRGGGP